MTPYILILIIQSSLHFSLTQQEYSSQSACLQALKQVRISLDSTIDYTKKSLCIPK
jgi:hypothetical protein